MTKAYTRGVAKEFWLCKSNTVRKTDFIQIYQKSRESISTPGNIISAFREAGLKPHNPSIVIEKLQTEKKQIDADHQQTPPPTIAHDEDGVVLSTFAKTPHTKVEAEAACYKLIHEEPTKLEREKLVKHVEELRAELDTQKVLNEELMQRDLKEQERKRNARHQRITNSAGMTLGPEILEERAAEENRKKREEKAKEIEKNLLQTLKDLRNLFKEIRSPKKKKNEAIRAPQTPQQRLQKTPKQTTQKATQRTTKRALSVERTPITRPTKRSKESTPTAAETTLQEVKKTRSGRVTKPRNRSD